MVQRFIEFITEKKLFSPEDKVLLAVSGGIDSVAMLQCFKDAGCYNYGIAHCNFGLRGDESDEDALFVQKLAKKAKVPFHTHQFDTENFAAQEKVSIQMAARQLRYAWFKKVMKDYGYSFLATAHHKNDTFETVLFNLVRGTGISGLHGISSKSGEVVRPLLFADKEMIMDFVAQKNLSWREDSSNSSIKYARNSLRNEVVPVLKKINPDLENTFDHTLERLLQVEAVFFDALKIVTDEAVERKENDVYIALDVLKRKNVSAVMLWEILKEYGYSYVQSKDVAARMFEGAGRIFESSTYQLNVDREHLIISPKKNIEFFPSPVYENQLKFLSDALTLHFTTEKAKGFKITSQKNIAALDYDKLVFPLEVRKWQRGDVFFPLGMKQKKKLSDFMIDEKIPLNLKERVFVLTSNNAIVWVVGHRIDDRYKIADATERVLKVQVEQ